MALDLPRVERADPSSRLHQAGFSDSDVFFHGASHRLLEMVPAVIERVFPRIDQPELLDTASWHPEGFMVFRLGKVLGFGEARLHVWPKGLRRREIRGLGQLGPNEFDGAIHNHAWHIASYIFEGYRDEVLDVGIANPEPGMSGEALAANGLYRALRVTYNASTGEDELVRLSHFYHASINDLLSVDKPEHGQLNQIEGGDFHRTVIPKRTLAATLLISSDRLPYIPGPDVLFRDPVLTRVVGTRRPVLLEEATKAKKQLLEREYEHQPV